MHKYYEHIRLFILYTEKQRRKRGKCTISRSLLLFSNFQNEETSVTRASQSSDTNADIPPSLPPEVEVSH